MGPTRRGRAGRRLGSAAVAVALGGSLGAADFTTAGFSSPPAAPNERAGLPFAVSLTLRQAFPVALRRLLAVPDCRGLFDGLSVGGDAALRRTLYYPPSALGFDRPCRLGGIAFTATGRVQTGLCPRFAVLPVERAALVLIHEALHFAGLPESPPTPGAMTSTEINDRIAERCGL